MFTSIIFIFVSVWVLLSLLLYFFQPRFVYYPYSNINATPEEIALAYEDVTVTTEDDIKIHGWWIPHYESRATLLFFHGNAGNLSHRLESIKIFHELGLSVFIIDYRGYGNSEGSPDEKGTYSDAKAAWNYLVKKRDISSENIIIFGRSLGAAIATWLAQKHPPRALIIESTFTSVLDMARHYYPFLPTSLITRIKYPTEERISEIKAPVLVIHSQQDEIVPYRFGKMLYDAVDEPKTFLDIQGGHNEGFYTSGQTYINGLNSFITQTLNNETFINN